MVMMAHIISKKIPCLIDIVQLFIVVIVVVYCVVDVKPIASGAPNWTCTGTCICMLLAK